VVPRSSYLKKANHNNLTGFLSQAWAICIMVDVNYRILEFIQANEQATLGAFVF